MTHSDRRARSGPRPARRREGAAAAVADATAADTGSAPAVGGPALGATLARGIFWRTGRARAAAALAGLCLPLMPGLAHAGPLGDLLGASREVTGTASSTVDAVVQAVPAPATSTATATGTPSVAPGLPSEAPAAPAVPGTTPAAAAAAPAPAYDPAKDPYSLRTSALNTGAAQAWVDGVTGKGVKVAVIDSGVSITEGLDATGKVTPGIDLSFDAISDADRHRDGYGHGTHLAGIIAGDDARGTHGKRWSPKGFIGVAPDASVVGVKIGDAEGHVDVSQVIAGIDWVIATRKDSGVRVVNLSFNAGGLQSYTLDPLSYAVERAWKAGLVVVVSAGNDGDALGRLQNPAQNPYVLAVGALDDKGTADRADDVVPDFSARGDGVRNPDVVAPGYSVPSLAAPGSFAEARAKKAGPRLVRASGTSQAAAYVAGAAALLLEQRPDLTPDQVKALLKSSAATLPGVDVRKQGAGALDITTALRARTPGAEAVQEHAASTGLGSLDASRGERRLVVDGELLSGEKDVWGQPFDAAAYVKGLPSTATSAGTGTKTQVGGLLKDPVGTVTNGDPSGASWSGASWSGASWSGASWSGASWSGASWSGASWSGASWSGASWSGASWSGASWSGASWS